MRESLIPIFYLLILISLLSSSVFGQEFSPERLGFEHYTIKDKELGEINYYLTADDSDEKKPLLVYLDGSGWFPLFQEMEGGYGTTVMIRYQELKKDYRVLLISKPGVPFVDSVGIGSDGRPEYEAPAAYTERLSLQWRTDAADKIITQLVKKKEVSREKVVVLGISEGGQVGPYVAEKNKYVTHLILFAGNGLNQFFDPLITARMKAFAGVQTEEETQYEVDSLFTMYEKMYNKPKSTSDFWWGHTYQRWASFTERDPLEALVKLDIPIYFANGSLDENSVLSADYIRLEFLRRGKTNLTYVTYPNYDHQLNKLEIEDGEVTNAEPKMQEALAVALKWLE